MGQTRATDLEAHGIVLDLFVHVLFLLQGHCSVVQPVHKHWDGEGGAMQGNNETSHNLGLMMNH